MQKLLIIGWFIISLPQILVATQTRTIALGESSLGVIDECNIWILPQSLWFYPDRVIFEMDRTQFRQAGVHFGSVNNRFATYLYSDSPRMAFLDVAKPDFSRAKNIGLFYSHKSSSGVSMMANYGNGLDVDTSNYYSNELSDLKNYGAQLSFGYSIGEAVYEETSSRQFRPIYIGLSHYFISVLWNRLDYRLDSYGWPYQVFERRLSLVIGSRMHPFFDNHLIPYAILNLDKYKGRSDISGVGGFTIGACCNLYSSQNLLIMSDLRFSKQVTSSNAGPYYSHDKIFSIPTQQVHIQSGAEIALNKSITMRIGAFWAKTSYEYYNYGLLKEWSEFFSRIIIGGAYRIRNFEMEFAANTGLCDCGQTYIGDIGDPWAMQFSLKYCWSFIYPE